MSNDLMLDVSQAGELKAAFRRARGSDGSLWTNGAIKRLSERSFLGVVLDVLMGRSKIVPNVYVGGEIVEGDMDPVIRTALNVEKLEFLSHRAQTKLFGWQPQLSSGTEIYALLKKSGDLKRCLDLQDGRDIQKRGIIFFLKYFKKGKKYILWKSVVPSASGDYLVVSCLVSYFGDKVLIETEFLSAYFSDRDITLKFPEENV